MSRFNIRQYPLRNWNEFADASRFKLPTPETAADRVTTNLQYFAMNYVCLTVLLFFYAIIARPQILFVLALSICAGAYLVGIRQEPLELNGALVSDARVLQVITAVTLVLIVVFGGLPVVCALLLSLSVIVAHSMLRSRSLKAKATTFIADMKGENIAGSLVDEVAVKTVASGFTNPVVNNDMQERQAATAAAVNAYHQTRDRMRRKYQPQL